MTDTTSTIPTIRPGTAVLIDDVAIHLERFQALEALMNDRTDPEQARFILQGLCEGLRALLNRDAT